MVPQEAGTVVSDLADTCADLVEVAGVSLVRVRLVPVEVFGTGPEPCEHCGSETGGGYGLMDAVAAWSDCNRAVGHIYRVDDVESRAGETITVYVPQSEMAKFSKKYGEEAP